MNTYTIDLGKWICGDGAESFPKGLGKGSTTMRNREGFMCCLGQCAAQAGVKNKFLSEVDPEDVARGLGILYDTNFVYQKDGEPIRNTYLTKDMIRINDESETTIWEKLCLLAERLHREGLTLLVTGELPL